MPAGASRSGTSGLASRICSPSPELLTADLLHSQQPRAALPAPGQPPAAVRGPGPAARARRGGRAGRGWRRRGEPSWAAAHWLSRQVPAPGRSRRRGAPRQAGGAGLSLGQKGGKPCGVAGCRLAAVGCLQVTGATWSRPSAARVLCGGRLGCPEPGRCDGRWRVKWSMWRQGRVTVRGGQEEAGAAGCSGPVLSRR